MTKPSIPTGEIVRAEGQLPYLQVGSKVIAALEMIGADADPNNDLYLAGEVAVGAFGVAACTVIVPHPQPRPYAHEDGPGMEYRESDIADPDVLNNPVRLSHFLDTAKGFAAVRTVLAPEVIDAKLREDPFLGPGLINKACIQDVIPREFDEERGLRVGDALGYEFYEEKFEPFLTRLLFAAEFGDARVLRAYTSWHSYRAHNSVVRTLNEANVKTVRNFDTMLGLLGLSRPDVFSVEAETGDPAIEA